MRLALVSLLLGFAACGDSESSGSGASAPGGAGGDGGSGGSSVGAGGAGAGAPGAGSFTFGTLENRVFRVAASVGAEIENISAALDALAPGSSDRRLVPSVNGEWLTLSTDRVACDFGECLAVVAGDGSTFEAVIVDGLPVGVRGTSAITNTGDVIVYSADGGPHNFDLFRIERSGAAWTSPELLSGDSTYAYNNMPAISFDESRVYFDCGTSEYPEDGGTDSCSVALDGAGFAVVVSPSALPNPEQPFTQFPHDAVGGVLFQGTWPIGEVSPETIWFLPDGAEPEPIGEAFTNAVSPCGLRDGRFGLLWLGGPDNPSGFHELTLVDQTGALIAVLTPGIDVLDIGIGCSD